MALASQTARGSDMPRSSYLMHRRSRRRSGRVFLFLGVVGVAALLVWWISSGRTPTQVAAGHGEEVLDHGLDVHTPTSRLPDPASQVGAQQANLNSATDRGAPPLSAPTTTTTRPTTNDDEALVVIEMGSGVRRNTPTTTDNAQASTTPTNTTPTMPVGAQTESATTPGSLSEDAVRTLINDATAMANSNRLVEARTLFNRALHDPRIHPADKDLVRDRMARLNDELLFSPRVHGGDPLTTQYTIASGDSLVRIAARNDLNVDWRLVQKVNNIADPSKISVGQKIKLVRGPFHAVVHKHAYRLDLYHGDPDAHGNRLYIRSFPVGLGETNSTPVGAFTVRSNSKLIDPAWRNPRTGEFFASKDPKNPLGKYWIGVDPADAATAAFTEYGLHGTIEPDSIGQDRSMGCVRLLAADIELLYGLLAERVSTVRIEP